MSVCLLCNGMPTLKQCRHARRDVRGANRVIVPYRYPGWPCRRAVARDGADDAALMRSCASVALATVPAAIMRRRSHVLQISTRSRRKRGDTHRFRIAPTRRGPGIERVRAPISTMCHISTGYACGMRKNDCWVRSMRYAPYASII